MRNRSYAISAITEHAPCLTGLPSRQVGEDPTCQGPTESTRPAPSSLTGGSTCRWGSRRSFCSLIRRLDTPSRAASRLSRRLKSLVSGFNWSSPSARSRPHRRCAGTRHELRTGLAEMRSAAADAAAQCGARLLAVGVPVLGSAVLPITDIRRFRTIASRFGYLAGTRGVCAGHVHVGVPDRETAVQVGNYLRPWLPALLALTANSPIHRGVDTGFASWRSIMLSRWPCSGPPPWFASVEHYDAVVEEMVECGVILDEGMINWDVRPSAHLPTVEVRVSDVPATVDETVLLATVVRALVMTALRSISRGGCAPKITAEALQAGYSMAAREGLTGHGIDLTSDLVVPAPDLLGLLVCHVRSALEELGEYRAAVAMLTEVVRCGNGASRQRRALRIRNHVSDVTAMAAQSTLLVGRAALSSGADVFSPPIPRDSPRVAVKNGLP